MDLNFKMYLVTLNSHNINTVGTKFLVSRNFFEM